MLFLTQKYDLNICPDILKPTGCAIRFETGLLSRGFKNDIIYLKTLIFPFNLLLVQKNVSFWVFKVAFSNLW